MKVAELIYLLFAGEVQAHDTYWCPGICAV